VLQIFIGDTSSAALVTIVANVRVEAVVKKVEVVRNMGDLKGLATIMLRGRKKVYRMFLVQLESKE
jgi:hypothetical protein